jgi:hypothetical protein
MLHAKEQAGAFESPLEGPRLIVVATNVAETSLSQAFDAAPTGGLTNVAQAYARSCNVIETYSAQVSEPLVACLLKLQVIQR